METFLDGPIKLNFLICRKVTMTQSLLEHWRHAHLLRIFDERIETREVHVFLSVQLYIFPELSFRRQTVSYRSRCFYK